MNKKLAFTLIELLVVIAVIGILSGLIVVSMSGTSQKATIAKAQVFSNSLRNSLMLNLVSEWTFDVDGTDSWGTNNGTITGATITNSGCVFNSCLSSIGSAANNVNISNSDSLNTVWNTNHIFTFEVWINSTFFADYQGIINKRTSLYYSASPAGLFIGNDGHTLAFLIGTGVDAQTSTIISFNLTNYHDKWTHVVGTSTGSALRLYINGVSTTVNPLSFTQNPPQNTEPMTIGAFYAGARAFRGKIDNVRIYNTVISTSQIRQKYYLGLNSMLSNGTMNKKDYLSRINLVAINE
jgi:prepilin-type N-terminal cleavage/methylation domain-containing protein